MLHLFLRKTQLNDALIESYCVAKILLTTYWKVIEGYLRLAATNLKDYHNQYVSKGETYGDFAE